MGDLIIWGVQGTEEEVPMNKGIVLFAIIDGDCDDADPAVHPDAEEICNDDVDNNCNGLIDTEDETCQ